MQKVNTKHLNFIDFSIFVKKKKRGILFHNCVQPIAYKFILFNFTVTLVLEAEGNHIFCAVPTFSQRVEDSYQVSFFEFWLYTHPFKYNKKYSNDCKFFLSSLHKPLHCLSMLDKPIEFSFTTTGNIPKFPFVILEWKFPKNAALMNCR